MTEQCSSCGHFMGSNKVGLGKNPRWVCIPCFEKAMAAAGKILRDIRVLARIGNQPSVGEEGK